MRIVAASCLGLLACASDDLGPGDPRTFRFGPFHLEPGEERTDLCVSASLDNPDPLFVNSVELTTAVGFHHSNWVHVPTDRYRGPDGIWPCNERGFDEPTAAAQGGVLFAQSTQATHEVQAFPPGVAIAIPPDSKIVAGIHLLNGGDTAIDTPLEITLDPIPRDEVDKQLAALSFQYKALALPPHRTSEFTTTCDIGTQYQERFGRAPDFSIYHVLPHYHDLGTGMRIEAVESDGTSRILFENQQRIGDALGGALDPQPSMFGAPNLRFTCVFDNPRDDTVGWGVGDQEMCVFLGWSDSPNMWAGGVLSETDIGTPVDDGDIVKFERDCWVITFPALIL
jgi:hypothetical protein